MRIRIPLGSKFYTLSLINMPDKKAPAPSLLSQSAYLSQVMLSILKLPQLSRTLVVKLKLVT